MAFSAARGSGVLTLFTSLPQSRHHTLSTSGDHEVFTSNVFTFDGTTFHPASVTIPTALLPSEFQPGRPLYVEGPVTVHLGSGLRWELKAERIAVYDPLGVNPYLYGAVGRLDIHLSAVAGQLVLDSKTPRVAWVVTEGRSQDQQYWVPSTPDLAFRSRPGTYSYFTLMGTWIPEGPTSVSTRPDFVFEALPSEVQMETMIIEDAPDLAASSKNRNQAGRIQPSASERRRRCRMNMKARVAAKKARNGQT